MDNITKFLKNLTPAKKLELFKDIFNYNFHVKDFSGNLIAMFNDFKEAYYSLPASGGIINSYNNLLIDSDIYVNKSLTLNMNGFDIIDSNSGVSNTFNCTTSNVNLNVINFNTINKTTTSTSVDASVFRNTIIDSNTPTQNVNVYFQGNQILTENARFYIGYGDFTTSTPVSSSTINKTTFNVKKLKQNLTLTDHSSAFNAAFDGFRNNALTIHNATILCTSGAFRMHGGTQGTPQNSKLNIKNSFVYSKYGFGVHFDCLDASIEDSQFITDGTRCLTLTTGAGNRTDAKFKAKDTVWLSNGTTSSGSYNGASDSTVLSLTTGYNPTWNGNNMVIAKGGSQTNSIGYSTTATAHRVNGTLIANKAATAQSTFSTALVVDSSADYAYDPLVTLI